jgi:Tol biopolymer transport system component
LRSANRIGRRKTWAIVSAAVLTLWLVGGGCGGEQTQRTQDQIAFTSDRDGNDDIYVMDADGSSQTRLTTEAADDWEAAWSPDGEKIAFTRQRDSSHGETYVMDADGSNQTRLTTDGELNSEPTFRPQR